MNRSPYPKPGGKKRLKGLWRLFFFFITIGALALPGSGMAREMSGIGLEDEDMLLYLEAVTRIVERAAFVSSNASRGEIVQDTIRSYLRAEDPFSDYLDRAEYSAFRQSQGARYVGVGMDVERGADGNLLCFPYAGGPAERAGIKAGDALVKIEGVAVKGKSIFAVAARSRGKEGTRVVLTVSTGDGRERELRVKRESLKRPSVSMRSVEGLSMIKIESFSKNTKSELARALKEAAEATTLVIDLRGNRGGDLHAAIDSAGLLVDKGKRIGYVKTGSVLGSYESRGDGPVTASRLYLWQDERTASAAEFFVAALTDNERAISIGKRSFGKGSRQDVIELSDGSALVLTTGLLSTPNGLNYHGKGLEPTYPLSQKSPGADDYLQRTLKLIRLPELD